MVNVTLEKRISRLEAIANQYKSGQDNVLEEALAKAVENEDTETAAQLARKIRNHLLAESDNEMTLDRAELNTESASKFIASLKTLLEGSWATYRQALRDVPQQEGFPLQIQWPVIPGDTMEAEEEVTVSGN